MRRVQVFDASPGGAQRTLRASIEPVLHTRADIPGPFRAGFVVALVGVADDHRADVFAIEQVVDAQHLVEGQRAGFLLEARLPVEQGVAGRGFVDVAVFDVEFAAVQAFDGCAEPVQRFPGELDRKSVV